MPKKINNNTIRLNDNGTIDNIESSEIAIDSFIVTESSTPDMNVNTSVGTIKNTDREYYHTPSEEVILVTAATSGGQKIGIIQKDYTSDAIPEIKYSSIVGNPTQNSLTENAGTLNEGVTVRADFKWVNGTGSDIEINEFIVGLANFGSAYGDGTFVIYGDNGSGLPDMGNVLHSLGSFRLGYNQKDGTYGASGYKNIVTGAALVIGAGVTFHIVWDSTYEGGNMYYPESTVVAAPTDFTYTFLRDVNDAGTWNNWAGGSNSWDYSITFTTGSLEVPSPDADHISIATIGSIAVPINDSTDEVVEGSPTGTQVQLIPVNTNRQ